MHATGEQLELWTTGFNVACWNWTINGFRRSNLWGVRHFQSQSQQSLFHAGHNFAAQMLSSGQGWHQSVPATDSQSSALRKLWHVSHVWGHGGLIFFDVLSLLWFSWTVCAFAQGLLGLPLQMQESSVWWRLFIRIDIHIVHHFPFPGIFSFWPLEAMGQLNLWWPGTLPGMKDFGYETLQYPRSRRLFTLFTSYCWENTSSFAAYSQHLFLVRIQQHTSLWNEDPRIAASYQGAFKEKVAEATNNSNSWAFASFDARKRSAL